LEIHKENLINVFSFLLFAAPNESYMSCSKDALSNRGISGIDSECCAESFHFSPGQNTENIEVGVEDTPESRMEDYKDSAECGDFKNKRAAHYNEFKLGTSLFVSWIS
jgi:hypothetical protein